VGDVVDDAAGDVAGVAVAGVDDPAEVGADVEDEATGYVETPVKRTVRACVGWGDSSVTKRGGVSSSS
jgi:hypothetical protein